MTRACPVCAAQRMVTFLERSQVPVHQNLLCHDVESARGVARGDLVLAACADCGFVSNLAFDASKLSYGADYDNNQICSAAFSTYVDELVQHLTVERAIEGLVVEVGCGKGYFLRRLVEANPKITGLGFDPTYVGPAEDLGGRLRFERRFYDKESRHLQPAAVVCRHVIEHVADPRALVAAVRAAVADRTRVFFETPSIEWILSNRVLWDFFYEHCSLFSAESLRRVFASSGFDVVDVREIFGGQYLWCEAVPGAGEAARAGDDHVARLGRAYGESELQSIRTWRSRLAEAGAQGGVAVWGAGAKGATFVNLADPARSAIRCVVDVNPAKQGKFIPGTGHPIVSPTELPAYGVKSAFLMNPNYRAETEALLRQLHIDVQLIDRGLT